MNIISRIVLRTIKESKLTPMYFDNLCKGKSISTALKNTMSLNGIIEVLDRIGQKDVKAMCFKHKLIEINKKILFHYRNEIIDSKINIVELDYELLIKLSDYFNDNGLVWYSLEPFKNHCEKYFSNGLHKNKVLCISNGLITYSSYSHVKNIHNPIKLCDFINYYENLKFKINHLIETNLKELEKFEYT